MILAGDVGGTKTNLALFTFRDGELRRDVVRSFRSATYPSLEAILDEFLAGRLPVELACVGVAGPVKAGRSHLTNLPWAVNQEAVRRACGARAAFLVNDLQAMAFSIPFLPPDGLATLQEGEPDPEGNIAVAAAGTGLGEAYLLRNGSRYVPLPSEGGHADFAPRNEREVALLLHLRKEYGRVSAERVISGPGLHAVYRFLREAEGRPESPEVEARLAAEDPPRVIVSAGVAGTSGTCRDALRLFASVYGALAGNLALQYVATGGVALGGGVSPAILSILSEGGFLEAFRDKGRFERFLEKVPVKVILDEKAALLGAARYAQSMGGAA
ncbi:MAG: glucokinase [Verrucomicrobiota bacterium]